MSLPRPLTAGAALTPLRLFLGLTFVYAGYQKLSDPGYLHAGSLTYIGTQLKAFSMAHRAGSCCAGRAPLPTVAGVGVALTEIAIGLLVTMGLMTRIAAAAGLALNLLLFLTASWNTYPYFLGSDIVFVFAWLPFVLAGADGQPALDHQLARSAAREQRRGGMQTYDGRPRSGATRAQILQDALSATAVGTLAIAGIAYLLRGSNTGSTLTAAQNTGTGSVYNATTTMIRPAARARPHPARRDRTCPRARPRSARRPDSRPARPPPTPIPATGRPTSSSARPAAA